MGGHGLACGLGRGQNLSDLSRNLAVVADAGFTHAEVESKSLGVVINGELHEKRLELLLRAIEATPLKFTVHGSEIASGRGGNLVDVTDPLQRVAVESDIKLAAAIGASVLVYHAGTLRDANGSWAAMKRGMQAERDALSELGDVAGKAGITIGVENRDPVTPYLDRYVYGLSLIRLGEQVAAVNHPNVGITFDTGHAWLSATYLDFDYLADVRQIAPLVAHIHLSDNFGNPMLNQSNDGAENLMQGLGDLHLPPGWGSVPFADIAEIPFPRQPVSIVEMRGSFLDHLADVERAARRFANAISPTS